MKQDFWTSIENEIKLMIHDGCYTQDEIVYQAQKFDPGFMSVEDYKHLVGLVEVNLNRVA